MESRNIRIARMLSLTCQAGEVVIMDLDGTLANGSHRLHLLPTKDMHLTETWREFNAAAKDDAPIANTIEMFNALIRGGKTGVVLTGRSGEFLSDAVHWLSSHKCHYDFLVMRGAEDNRKDTVIKEEFLRAVGLDRILCAFDDSPAVIAHFRSMGITTYAVTEYADKDRHDLKSHGVEKLPGTCFMCNGAGFLVDEHREDSCSYCGGSGFYDAESARK